MCIRDRDKVLIMPAHASPFKLNRKIAPGEDRFRMVQLAVEDNEHLEASDFESASDRISYTADTMRMLEEIYPEDQLFFITGADSILEIERWKDCEELLRRYPFLVGGRPGYRLSLIHILLAEDRKGLFADISKICEDMDVHITGVMGKSNSDNTAQFTICLLYTSRCV